MADGAADDADDGTDDGLEKECIATIDASGIAYGRQLPGRVASALGKSFHQNGSDPSNLEEM